MSRGGASDQDGIVPARGREALSPQAQHLLAHQGDHPAEAALLAPALRAPTRLPEAQQGISETLLVVLEPGVRAYFKPQHGQKPRVLNDFGQSFLTPPLNECAAWHLARELGEPLSAMVPSVVYREFEGDYGALIEHRDGAPNPRILFAAEAEKQRKAAGLFDALIGQQDRNALNYLWNADTKLLSLIDHGYSFAREGDYGNDSFFLQARYTRGEQDLDDAEREILERVVASPDALGLGTILPADRCDRLVERARLMIRSGRLFPPKRF